MINNSKTIKLWDVIIKLIEKDTKNEIYQSR